jgi:hypothetical protein
VLQECYKSGYSQGCAETRADEFVCVYVCMWVLQECHTSVPRVLHESYKGGKRVLQGCYKGVTRVRTSSE